MPWRPLEISKGEVENAVRRFRKKARFLVDESLAIGTTELLRDRGWNVKDIVQAGLKGRSDEDVLAYALRKKRILLTHDKDFLDDRRFPPHRNPGIVVLPGGSGDEVALIRALFETLTLVGPFVEAYRGTKMEMSADRVFSVRQREASGEMKTARYHIQGSGTVFEWIDK